jgi:hypothetical protein
MIRYLEADLTWTGERFEPGVRIGIDDTGRIASVGTQAPPPDSSIERLDGRALLPGFVNVHSHAFQRGLRGRGETFPAGAAGSFWTWREAMYGLVETMTRDRLLELSFQAFREMTFSLKRSDDTHFRASNFKLKPEPVANGPKTSAETLFEQLKNETASINDD